MNKNSWYTIWTFVRLSTKRFFRDRLALFFTIVFPLIFLFVFGGLNSGSGDIKFNVAVINQSQSSFAKEYADGLSKNDVLDIKPDVHTMEAAKERMSRGELSAAIVLPPDFGEQGDKPYPHGEVQIVYTQNNEQAGRTLATILDGQLERINDSIIKTETPFTVKAEQINERSLSTFDYTFAGLLGFAIVGLGIFGPVNVFPELKKQGVLRRLHTTPLKVWQYFMATAVSQTVIGLLTLVIMFAVAISVFHLDLVGNVLELAIFLALSIVSILGIGLAIGGWASNERQAAPLANIVVFPMMFLSGTFFPRFIMPEWLQDVSALLPLTPVIDGIRLIATEGQHLVDIGPQIGLVLLWTVVVYLIAFRVFRWE